MTRIFPAAKEQELFDWTWVG